MLPEAQFDALPVSIFVVIVLYKMRPEQSVTYRMLLDAIVWAKGCARVQVMLYDNTPGTILEPLPEGVHYVASPMNAGLSTAYNRAAAWAASAGFDWLLTLDQDTLLPETVLEQFASIAVRQQRNPKVAAIVPQLFLEERALSPNYFKAGMFPRYFAKCYQGLPEKAVYAFNSGSLVRISALQQIGGYSQLFWLDNSDTYIYRRFELAGLRVFVTGSIQLQHDFSMRDIKNKMSLKRYRDSLESGSTFWDIEMNWLQGIEQTTRLVRLYLSQVYRKRDPVIKQITKEVIWNRLTRSRKKRVQAWLAVQQARISSYGEQDQSRLTPAPAASSLAAWTEK